MADRDSGMKTQKPRVADFIIGHLWDLGVTHIFGVTGGNCLFLTDAIYCHGKIKFVPMHGERDAGYAAIGYAKYKNSLGVAVVTTGCGSTNILTAVLSAWQDSVPLVVLAGQVPSYVEITEGRQRGTQGAYMEPIVRTITKRSVEIWGFPMLSDWITETISLANTPRKGPVWISIPLDVQRSLLEQE